MTTAFADYVGLAEAAAYLTVHPQSLRRHVKSGRLPATLFGNRYLINRRTLQDFKVMCDPRPGRPRRLL